MYIHPVEVCMDGSSGLNVCAGEIWVYKTAYFRVLEGAIVCTISALLLAALLCDSGQRHCPHLGRDNGHGRETKKELV